MLSLFWLCLFREKKIIIIQKKMILFDYAVEDGKEIKYNQLKLILNSCILYCINRCFNTNNIYLRMSDFNAVCQLESF